jgi:hypothetical protein
MIMKKILVLFALLTSISAYAALTEYTYTTKYGYTGDERIIEWCQPDQNDFPGIEWDVEIVDFGANQVVETITGVQTTSISWTPPRTGHYIFRVRNRYNGQESNWIESTTSVGADVVCGAEQNGWWLFAWIKPVDDIIEF